MSLSWTPLLLLGAALETLVPGGSCGSLTHSLWYLHLQDSEPNQGLHQYFMRGYLDDQPIARYDSLTGKMEPLVPWMQEEKERFQALEWIFGIDVEKFKNLSHQTGGLHIWQVILGCELREDGSKGGFLHYGYNGMDFISFEKETLRWVPAHPQAQKVKEEWEDHPGLSKRKKIYLENTCTEWLQTYQSYRKEAVQRIEPPVGKVTLKVVNDSLEVLICQVFGFYPKEIQATWTRDGEVWKNETLHRNVAPNSDGTYYVWLSIEIDPKERDCFWCHLEHEGLQEPLVLSFKDKTARTWWIPVVITVIVILGLWISFLSCRRWSYGKPFHQEGTACPDQDPSAKFPSPPVHNTDEIQPQATFQPQITSECKASYGHQRAPKSTVLFLHGGGCLKISKSPSGKAGKTDSPNSPKSVDQRQFMECQKPGHTNKQSPLCRVSGST